MFDNIISRIKQHPVLIVNMIFTFFCATFPLSFTFKILLYASWILVPLLFPTQTSLPCIVYMSLYMQIIRYIEIFAILVCIAFCIILIKQIIFLNKNKLINKYFKILIYYSSLLIIPLFYSIFINNGINIYFIYYLNMINILLLIYLNKDILNKDLILMYVFGIFTSSALSLILYLAGLHYFPFYGGTRFTAFLPLCNTLGAVCAICIVLLYKLICNKCLKPRSGFVMIGALSIIGIITFSKTFFIVFCISLFVIMCNTFKQSKNKKRLLIIYIISIFALSPAILYYGMTMFNRFFVQHDYYKNILNIITTGRLDIWNIYLTPWLKSIRSVLLGVGISYKYPTVYSSHSLYIGYLSRLGIFGFVMLGYFVYLIIQNQINVKEKFKYLPLIILMLICFAEDISYNTFYFIPFILSVCSCCDTHKRPTDRY